MLNKKAVPTYADFRAELDRLYPDVKGRIAICNHSNGPDDSWQVSRDLEEQLSYAVRKELPSFWPLALSSSLQTHKEAAKAGQTFSFCCIAHQSPVALILADCNQIKNTRYVLYAMSDQSVPSCLLDFNAAVVNPGVMGWMFFYHELSHALIRLDRHPLHKRDGRDVFVEESICDSFAALHMLKRFGPEILPFLDVIADARLSNMSRFGPRYFTGQSLRAIARDARAGLLDGLDGASPDEVFAGALSYARNNDLDRDVVNAYHQFCDAIRHKQAPWNADIIANFSLNRLLSQSSLRDVFKESQTIMADRYLSKTPVRTAVRAFLQKCLV
ncbi:hypothetical protein [Micavibrio aeruginosavorus]|uniref:hypothetical protein n=1 Tax=Micavibrio aeruginosavorus TaxID=349221 RepID=UPI003F4AB4B9